jgi:ATP-dependent helicase HrpA
MQDAADQAHAKFRDEQSDFLSYLHLWKAFHHQMKHLSGSKLRRWCKENFVSFVRMREWHDIHQQLHSTLTEMKLIRRPNRRKAKSRQ